MRVRTPKEGNVAHRLVHTGAGYKGGSPSSVLLVDPRIEAIQGTFSDRGGELATEFVMDKKVGDPDPNTGENLA